jgi:hypothetical protein
MQKGNPSSRSSESIWKNQGSETGLFKKHTLVGEEGKPPKILVGLVVSQSR